MQCLWTERKRNTAKMSIAIAQPRHIFGLRSSIAGNIAFHDEQTIVFPSGANCILYNTDAKTQRFIPGSEKSEGMTAMVVSPNRRYIAIAEKGEKATITIYDLHSLRKRKILSSPDIQSSEFVSLAFSPDSKYLVAQGGKPDWTLLYWTWEKSKVMASTKTSNPQTNGAIYQVCLVNFICNVLWQNLFVQFVAVPLFVTWLYPLLLYLPRRIVSWRHYPCKYYNGMLPSVTKFIICLSSFTTVPTNKCHWNQSFMAIKSWISP